jgi:hypothetical protein
MSERLVITKSMFTLGALAVTLFGILTGVATTAWQAKAMVDDQTAAIASLRQTLDQKVEPALAQVVTNTGRLAGHDTRLAVIERSCCGPSLSATIGDSK